MNNFFWLSLSLFTLLIKSEIVLINNDDSPVDITNTPPSQMQQLSNIYYNIICKYQWPTAIEHVLSMDDQERNDYFSNAFSNSTQNKIVNDFISNKVQKVSHGQYKTVQLSTTLFELSAINAIQNLFLSHNASYTLDDHMRNTFRGLKLTSVDKLFHISFLLYIHCIVLHA